MNPVFDPAERHAAENLIDLALTEDLGDRGDVTSTSLIEPGQSGAVHITCRASGILCGLPLAELIYARIEPKVKITTFTRDGAPINCGDKLATLVGPLRGLLSGERTLLNFLMHLSGVATLTRRFVDAAAKGKAVILDTRKTLPGYRLLEKYAVRCGGGRNHRMGLYDGILIKDNHLGAWQESGGKKSIAQAVEHARQVSSGMSVEVEVDSLDQLRDALRGKPEIILLDNMSPPMLREAVAIRNAAHSSTLLEASGGVNLSTIAEIAASGVDRISIGALTHSAPALDLAFDWGK